MSTSALRRLVPAARRTCASLVATGLVLGFATTSAGAVPAQVAPAASADTVAAVSSGFVQEGTPAAQGGRLVPWDNGWGLAQPDGSRPWELPDGVQHTGIDADGSSLLALRSDGQVTAVPLDEHWGPLPIPELPAGLRYTGVSLISGMGQPSAALLRSDGSIVGTGRSSSSTPTFTGPPAGMRYLSIDSGTTITMAVRSDGALVAERQRTSIAVPCPEALVPPTGTAYEAVNVTNVSWMAVRSDGAVVSCLQGIDTKARVTNPAAGTRFVGVDTARRYGYAARSDGTVVPFGEAPTPPVVPTGRSVVALSSSKVSLPTGSGEPGGAALLDDGSLLTWGGGRAVPAVPDAHGAYRAMASGETATWLLMDAPLLPTEITVTGVPDPWHMDTSATVSIDVTSSSGVTPRGTASVGYRDADGGFHAEHYLPLDRTGHAEKELRMTWPGARTLEVRFDGPPFRGAEVQRPFTVPEPSRTTVGVEGPESWRTGTDFVPFVTTVGTVDGTPAVSGTIQVVDRVTGGRLSTTGYGSDRSLDVSGLAPGPHELEVRYVADYAAASSDPVVRPVTVRPPSATRIAATLVDETVHYENQIDVEARVETLDGSAVECGSMVAELTDGTDLGPVAQGCSTTSSLELSGSAHTFGLAPGDHEVVVRWEGTRPADATSADAGPTLVSETSPLQFTIRRAETTTTVTGVTEDVAAGKVQVDVAVHGPGEELGRPAQVVLSVDGTDVATQTTEGLGDTSFRLDAAALPLGVLAVGARYSGSAWHSPSEADPVSWSHIARAFVAPTPSVVGTARVGSTLTTALGTWSPSPSTVAYSWQAGGVTIAGATASTLKVPASAVGKRITVRVTGTRAGYPTKSVTSAPTAAVVPGTFAAPRPTVKGTAKVGRTLTVSRGTWSPAPSSVKYVWKANGTTISTRTSSTFVVPASARGKRLTVTVTGSRAGYTTRSVTSAATATVVRGTFTASRPTITGTKRVGRTLTVSRGTWSPAPSSVTYVWKADGVRIATRESKRFVVPARARGKHLTVTVVGSRTGYATRSVTSYRTSTIR
ncbi:hypothetical protein [Krasilnikoviella flava]|uniref:Ig-like domain (Group 3) n=1 Tax=Krasilnikoviella flava TaxID=526729 RepID=A0A1T5IBF3_9MICO|nr:hypothetical protein [Krasilnikoviella flava]SKC36479.1 hypothetical protein SAMN04324258_0287 [Krasilnikoviella flava]